MSGPGDSRHPTEPLPAPRSRSGSTEPLPSGGRPPSGARDRRLWIVAGILALVLAGFVGFLIGRGQAPGPKANRGPEPVGGPRRACAAALELADRGIAVQQRALANRAALAEAVAVGDTDLIARLDEEFDLVSRRLDKIEAHMRKFAKRCRG